jgi:hypothetical protein
MVAAYFAVTICVIHKLMLNLSFKKCNLNLDLTLLVIFMPQREVVIGCNHIVKPYFAVGRVKIEFYTSTFQFSYLYLRSTVLLGCSLE